MVNEKGKEFFHEQELKKLEHSIESAENGDVIVINGVWGFGKTEVIEEYKKRNPKDDFINIELWNSGFETDVLYYFYQEIVSYEKKKKQKIKLQKKLENGQCKWRVNRLEKKLEKKKTVEEEFLTFFKMNIVFLPIMFLLFSFLSVNFWIPLLRKLLTKNQGVKFLFVDYISWGSFIIFVIVSILYYVCYLKRDIVKFIVFKKNFNSFFHRYFVKEIITELKSENNSFLIIEDVDRFEGDTIKELTTVIDSLKKEIEKTPSSNKCIFIVCFDVRELNKGKSDNQRREYYFDKVEKMRVNMMNPEDKALLQLKNFEGKMSEFDLILMKDALSYFTDYITLRSIEKFASYCEVMWKDADNMYNHIANLFVKFILQEKYFTEIDSLENKNGIQTEINTLLNKKDDSKIFKDVAIFSDEKNLYGNKEVFIFLIESLLFYNHLPYKYPVYRYDSKTLKKYEVFIQTKEKKIWIPQNSDARVSTIEELAKQIEKRDFSKSVKVLAANVGLESKERSENILRDILRSKKLLLDVEKIMRPILKLDSVFIEGVIFIEDPVTDDNDYDGGYQNSGDYPSFREINIHRYLDILFSFKWDKSFEEEWSELPSEQENVELLEGVGDEVKEYAEKNADYYDYQEWLILFILWIVGKEKSPFELSEEEKLALKFNEEILGNLFLKIYQENIEEKSKT